MNEIATIIIVLIFMVVLIWLTNAVINRDQRRIRERGERLDREMQKINDRLNTNKRDD